MKSATLWMRFMVWLGMRSKCCYATTRDDGYSYDQTYCSDCGNRCDNI